MPYVLSIERMAREKGRREGREEGRREGREEGRREGWKEVRDPQADLLLKLLQLKLQGVPEPIAQLIRGLEFDRLMILSNAALELESWPQVLQLVLIDPIEGLQQGVLRQVAIAFLGELSEGTEERLEGLSIDQVQVLSTEIQGWSTEADFLAWLGGDL
jgi:hypothetical protein